MNNDEIKNAVQEILRTEDRLIKHLMFAGLVTKLLKQHGFDMVVVGGSAIEFYTEGEYLSGDIDLCRTSTSHIPTRVIREVMNKLGAKGLNRNFNVNRDLYIDILGIVEQEAPDAEFQTLETPYGEIQLMPAEELLVERLLMAVYPHFDGSAYDCAKTLCASCLTGNIDVHWDIIDKLAANPLYGLKDELEKLKTEVSDELKEKADMGRMEKIKKVQIRDFKTDMSQSHPKRRR